MLIRWRALSPPPRRSAGSSGGDGVDLPADAGYSVERR